MLTLVLILIAVGFIIELSRVIIIEVEDYRSFTIGMAIMALIFGGILISSTLIAFLTKTQ